MQGEHSRPRLTNHTSPRGNAIRMLAPIEFKEPAFGRAEQAFIKRNSVLLYPVRLNPDYRIQAAVN